MSMDNNNKTKTYQTTDEIDAAHARKEITRDELETLYAELYARTHPAAKTLDQAYPQSAYVERDLRAFYARTSHKED